MKVKLLAGKWEIICGAALQGLNLWRTLSEQESTKYIQHNKLGGLELGT
jgi:hypothetical protein